jgi:hypothetical protein
MNKYKGIEFAKGYNKSFADFKIEFGSTHIFNNMYPDVREKELKKAYEIAINQSVNNKIDVIDAEIIKPDGNITTTNGKSQKPNSRKGK